jgi:hypothetical protein
MLGQNVSCLFAKSEPVAKYAIYVLVSNGREEAIKALEAGATLITDNVVKNKKIPISVAWVKHLSWCGYSKRLMDKIVYQNSRWSSSKTPSLNDDGCSYSWNELENRIEFSEK